MFRHLGAWWWLLSGGVSAEERTRAERHLTDLDHGFTIADFDISADGCEIIFDQDRDQSDLVLIDLAPR